MSPPVNLPPADRGLYDARRTGVIEPFGGLGESAAMSTVPKRPTWQGPAPLLRDGDRLTQAEFHRRYEAYPDPKVKFELIGGIVHMASPMRLPHAQFHPELSFALMSYRAGTPGVGVADNATAILNEENEPQPDLLLRILPECGGQTWEDERGYMHGSPELIAEVSHSSRRIDLGRKRTEYRRAGVQEYLVLAIEEQRLYWFHFPSRRQLRPDRQGVWRSRVFPGLWIDAPALLARDSPRLIATLQQGLATPEHAAFVERLRAARR
jgi:Uma2 family endonuclease